MTLGAAPELEARLEALYDGNRLLHGRRLAGTALAIGTPDELAAARPPAVVLFAVSHAAEILADWRRRLPGTRSSPSRATTRSARRSYCCDQTEDAVSANARICPSVVSRTSAPSR